MNTARVERVLWFCTIIGVVWTIIALFHSTSSAALPVEARSTVRPSPGAADAVDLESLAEGVVRANPFRLDRAPAALSFADARAVLSVTPEEPEPARAPLPELVIRGIVGGPPWEALIDGVPGRSGIMIVRAGDTLGDVIVRAIRRDSLTLQRPDTTWVLFLVAPWK